MSRSRESVCMVVHDHYPKDVRVLREARAASQAGWDVTVVCLRHPDEAAEEVLDGVRVRRIPVAHEPGSRLGRILYEYLAATVLFTLAVLRILVRGRPSVVHIHNPPDFLIVAGVIPRLLGSRLVLDVHDLTPLMFDVRFHGRRGSGLVVRALTILQRVAAGLADRVITVHEPYARALAASGVPAIKTTIVMNSPDDAVLQGVLDRRPATAPPSNGFTLAYHGTITHWYGVELLVDAVARLKDTLPEVSARVLGDGDALAATQERARELGVDERIEFSGRFLPLPDTLSAVADASCGVVPNLPSALNQLTLSAKMIEYAALGIPVVAARLDTQAYHFSDDEVTFFEAGSLDGLVAALVWVAEHPEEARAKAERARARAESYAWPKQRARLIALLSALAAERRGKPPVTGSTSPSAGA